jgi:hypothetical protein
MGNFKLISSKECERKMEVSISPLLGRINLFENTVMSLGIFKHMESMCILMVNI